MGTTRPTAYTPPCFDAGREAERQEPPRKKEFSKVAEAALNFFIQKGRLPAGAEHAMTVCPIERTML